ncbi:MAG: hypothetical protein Q8R35_03405 [bacterium]|nr:hypothetical protein [bacterium]
MEPNTEFKTEEVERRLNALPDAVAAALESSETARVIFDAGRKQGLAIDTIGEIAKLIGYAMLGLVSAADLTPKITSLVGDKKKADELAAVINRDIFLPIRDAMKRMYGAPWGEPVRPEPSPMPAPPMPPRPAAGTGSRAVSRLEPLIIRPLPSPAQISPGETWAGKPPYEAGGSGQRTPQQAVPSATGQVAYREQPAANIAAPVPAPRVTPGEKPAAPPTMPMPAPPVLAKPVPLPVPKPFEAVPPRKSEQPTPPKPAASEPAAPIIRPLGTPPSQEKKEMSRAELGQQESGPPKPVSPVPLVPQPIPPKREPYQPPPPTQAYERSREAFQRELASATAGQPTAELEIRPAPGPSAPPSPLGTKEALQREIEKFRQPAADSGQRTADSTSGTPPPTPPGPKPLKLPQEKIPKPSAPERYAVDPYKEPTE